MRNHGLRRSRRTGQSLLCLLGCLSVAGYFVHHIVNGTHGEGAKARLEARAVVIDREIGRLVDVRDRLARDVAALSANPPSPDITEEIARDVLGMMRPGEVVLSGR